MGCLISICEFYNLQYHVISDPLTQAIIIKANGCDNYLGNVGIGIVKPSARFHVAAPWGTVQARFTQMDSSGGDGRYCGRAILWYGISRFQADH